MVENVSSSPLPIPWLRLWRKEPSLLCGVPADGGLAVAVDTMSEAEYPGGGGGGVSGVELVAVLGTALVAPTEAGTMSEAE
jgi:hypothetical protein